jgi:hypothetical protein
MRSVAPPLGWTLGRQAGSGSVVMAMARHRQTSSPSLWLMKTIMKNYANITAIFLCCLAHVTLRPATHRMVTVIVC